MDVLWGSPVNGMSKLGCQLVSVGKSGQRGPLDSGQNDPFKSGAPLMSVGGGADGKLGVLSQSLWTLQAAFSGKVRTRLWLPAKTALPANILQDAFIRESTGPVDESVNPGDNCALFGASTTTSAVVLPVTSGCDRFSRGFLGDTDPTKSLEACRFLGCVYWHSWSCLYSILLARSTSPNVVTHFAV